MSDPILNSSSFHEGLRLGLDDAYLTLWHEGLKRLTRFYIARGFVNEAEDLWSETHMKLRRTRCSTFDPAKGSFEGWLYTVGKNVANDLMRKRESSVSIDDCIGLATSDSNEKEEGGLRYLEVLVKRAEKLLRPDDRTILSLRIVEELSYDSISKELGISVPAVTKRVSRAVERLWIEMERLSTRELPRRNRRRSRRSSGTVVSAPDKKQKKSAGSR